MPKSPKHPHWEDQQANDRAALDCRTVGKGLLYMKMSVYANRIGGFTALNQGKIANCFTDAKIKHSTNVAGFAFENGGDMSHSVVQGIIYYIASFLNFIFFHAPYAIIIVTSTYIQ